jgi:(p)ppGpp synthase/HD superfamily hydrolase
VTALEKAIVLATRAHARKDQRDKGGALYILHPLRVMLKMKTEPEMMAAVLHDVVEDTHCTLADLRKGGIPDEVVQAVDCLTKREGESYDDFIKRVKTNSISLKVKLADLADNMDITRIAQLSVDDAPRLNKYLRAWRDLSGDSESKPKTKSSGKRTLAAREKRSG